MRCGLPGNGRRPEKGAPDEGDGPQQMGKGKPKLGCQQRGPAKLVLTAEESESPLLLVLQSEESVWGRVGTGWLFPGRVAEITVDIPCLSVCQHSSLGSGPPWASRDWPSWGWGKTPTRLDPPAADLSCALLLLPLGGSPWWISLVLPCAQTPRT